jgi:cysteinyl-tRNA synthetase
MALNLYNTQSKKIEAFTPLNGNEVSFYACGPTVYDYTHIGHMRKYIGDDILRRTLSYLGYTVTHVMNITDVGHLTNDSDEGDDKFEKKAQGEGKSVWEIAQYYTDYFHRSMDAVGVLRATHETKATDHIKEMIALVETLTQKGFAYETSQAIYFDTSKDEHYGKLSGQHLHDKEEGSREDVVTDPEKRNPTDFSLWFKRVGRFATHTMYWPSPWGDGFPGWHIECSAMSMHYLGDTLDIHSGGIDHIPVHHENEIAQSECATGHQFVRFWVHHNFLNVDGEKMSKSKQNFYTLDTLIEKNISPLSMRILCMQTSYRKPLNFTWDSLESAFTSYKKLYHFVEYALQTSSTGGVLPSFKEDFTQALCDDLNMSKALAVVWELLSSNESTGGKLKTLLDMDAVLGLRLSEILPPPQDMQTILTSYQTLRENKDYEKADALRADMQSKGYTIESRDGAFFLQTKF